MGPRKDLSLAAAARAAHTATDDLMKALAAHEVTIGTLRLTHGSDWPAPVKTAYDFWEDRVGEMARILIRRVGGTADTTLSARDYEALTIMALVLALGFGA
jgi:hypothetical protein